MCYLGCHSGGASNCLCLLLTNAQVGEGCQAEILWRDQERDTQVETSLELSFQLSLELQSFSQILRGQQGMQELVEGRQTILLSINPVSALLALLLHPLKVAFICLLSGVCDMQ